MSHAAEHDQHIVGSLIVVWDGRRGNVYRLAVLPLEVAADQLELIATDVASRFRPPADPRIAAQSL